jgi:hypothetical protein
LCRKVQNDVFFIISLLTFVYWDVAHNPESRNCSRYNEEFVNIAGETVMKAYLYNILISIDLNRCKRLGGKMLSNAEWWLQAYKSRRAFNQAKISSLEQA